MVLSSEQIRKAEHSAVEYGMSWLRLMENAGSAAVREIRNHYSLDNKKVVILCGKGNNGGDGYVIARKLLEDNANIKVISVEPANTASSKEMLIKAHSLGIKPIDYESYQTLCHQYISDADIVIDAIFGTGFKGEVSGKYCSLISSVNSSVAITIAIDIPSGLWCDSGELNNLFIKADFTITFAAYKPCHLLYPSNSQCGRVVVTDIGMPKEAFSGIEPLINIVTNNYVSEKLPIRDVNCHKGLCGTAGLLVGSYGMAGAAIISTKAAIRSGVGIANVIIPDNIYELVGPAVPEAVCSLYNRDIDDFINLDSVNKIIASLNKSTSGLIGCGFGNNDFTKYTVKEILKNCNIPIVIDADGINVLNSSIDLIKAYKNSVILTPHPKEAAQLLGTSIENVQRDRLRTVKELAEKTGAICVLKGANTLIAEPLGKCYVVTDGNPGMSTAGSGDMLAGMIAAFLSQGLSPIDSTLVSVKLHALSGDSAVRSTSILSLTPTDMIKELPGLLNTLYHKKQV